MLKKLSLFLFLISFCQTAFSQTGAWLPSGANTAYPRTMLKASELPAVRNSLSDTVIRELYNGVYNNAFGNITNDNTTSTGRRARATLSKNAGFVLILDRKPGNGSTTALSAAEKDTLQNRAIKLLESINTNVEAFTGGYEEWQWRSKELIDYMIAYDMLKGAGVADNLLVNARAKLHDFAGKLYKESIYSIFGFGLFTSIKNNHSLMTAAALGISAVVLNNSGSSTTTHQPQKWIDAAMWNIDNVLWKDNSRKSEPGVIAGYGEGPYYFKYAFINCLPFFRAMGNFLGDASLNYTYSNTTRSIKNPFFDTNYDNLYEWARIIKMPNGLMPALEDSYIDVAMPELALTGKSKYNWPLKLDKLHTSQRNTLDKQLNFVVDLRANYIAANTPVSTFNDTLFHSLPVAGNVVFRSSWATDATYMHLQAQNGRARTSTGGHNHADETSFIIQSQGQLLALDPGYLSYSRRSELGNAKNHNMILVNGAGPAIGTSGNANGADVFIREGFSKNNLTSSEITTTYGGANISRRTLFIRNKYFVLTDALTSSSNKNYQWQLHGYGLENGSSTTGTFTDKLNNENKGFYTKNGVTLLSHVTAENGASSYAKRTDQHEFKPNTTEDHTTMLVNKDNVQNTTFLSLLAPFTTDSVTTFTVPNTTAAAIKISDKNYNDFAFSRTDTVTLKFSSAQCGLQYNIESNASAFFFSENKAGVFSQFYFTNGNKIKYGNKNLVTSSRKVNFFFGQDDSNTFSAQVNDSATLKILVDYEVTSVNGNNIRNWSYDNSNKILNVSFSKAGSSRITMKLNPLPVELISFSATLKDNKIVELLWSTASEINNDRFDIERSVDGQNWIKIGEEKGNGTTNTINHYSFNDRQLPEGSAALFYRLKQVDYNGDFEYSTVRKVTLPGQTSGVSNLNTLQENSGKLFRMYPNPASDFITITVEDGKLTNAFFVIFSATGQEVMRIVNAGKRTFLINLNHLPKGIYYCRMEDENSFFSTEKLILYGN